MTIIISFLAFILGTCIGSFLSAINHRLKNKSKGFIMGRSVCPSCKKKLSWYHLFPIFSFLFLKGKCAKCNKKISPYYPLLELSTGLTYLALTLNYGITNWPFLIFYGVIFTLFLAIFFYDLRYQEIPDSFSLPAIVIAFAGNFFFKLVDPASMAIGALVIGGFFALQFFLSKGKWIGGGDIRLGILIGAFLGLEQGAMALFIAYILGSFISIFLLISKKANRKTLIPFGPFLIIGLIVSLFYGKELVSIYQSLFLI